MSLLTLILLAVIQGITEFLPISSSGHLALFPQLTGAADQGQALDVAVHVGTLVAIMLFFRAETADAIRGTGHLLTGRWKTAEAKLAWLLALATVPVVIAGLILSVTGLADALRSVEVIAWATIGFGAVLWVADKKGPQVRNFEDWGLRDAIIMGLAQAVALIPGTSRSGITMTAARGLGYNRVDGARISLLMSIPTIIAAGVLKGKDLAESGDAALGLDMAVGAGLSCIAALIALALMMRMLANWTMTPFVIYRFALGGALLVWLYA